MDVTVRSQLSSHLAAATADWGTGALDTLMGWTTAKGWDDEDRADYLHYVSTVDFTHNRLMTHNEACTQVELDRSIDGFIG